MGVTEFVFEIGAAKVKIWGVLQGFPVVMETLSSTKTTESFAAINSVWYGTKILLLLCQSF